MKIDQLPEVKKHFKWAIKSNILRFQVTEEIKNTRWWLTVEYSEPNSNTPSQDGYTWKTICAQSLISYTRLTLINRITLMLTDRLCSKAQDVNGIMQDYKLTRK